MVMPFIDSESLYFILSIVGLIAVGIMFIFRSGKKMESLEHGNTQNHECILKLENNLKKHEEEVDKRAKFIYEELEDIHTTLSSLAAKNEAADKTNDRIWNLLVNEINKEKLPINQTDKVKVEVEKLPSTDKGDI